MPRLRPALTVLFTFLLILPELVQSEGNVTCATGFSGPGCEACVRDTYASACNSKCQVTQTAFAHKVSDGEYFLLIARISGRLSNGYGQLV